MAATCVEGCGGGGGGTTGTVSITPTGEKWDTLMAGTRDSVYFTVENTTMYDRTLTFTCSAGTNTACVSVSPATATIMSEGGSKQIKVVYSATAPTAWTSIGLNGAGGGYYPYGSYSVLITPRPSAAKVALRNYNPDNRDRSLCLTSGAGAGAAFQCGELLVAHGLPGYTTMGKERSPTLVYSSGAAYPTPVVAAAVTLGGPSGAIPQSVYAELRVNVGGTYTTRASATWASWGTPSVAETRQISLGYAAEAEPTGVYPFELTVRSQFTGGPVDTTVTGQLIVVNRKNSVYGRGWGLAGVESIQALSDDSKLWVGGDGSAKIYGKLDATTWVAPRAAYQDTLHYDAGTNTYVRTLRHGIQVTFDGAGRHIRTTNRVGQTTTFVWDPQGRLASVTVPPTGVTGTTYAFGYDPTTGALASITDPMGRTLTVSQSAGQIIQLTDPDTASTWFAYGSNDGRITAQLARRHSSSGAAWTTYGYYGSGANALLNQVSVPMDVAGTKVAVSTFDQWYGKGYGVPGATYQAVDTAKVYTKVDGPRTDVADTALFYVDRFGAPAKTVDPLGATTRYERTDELHPALVTTVRYHNIWTGSGDGRILTMTYNPRGNLTQVRDITSHLGAAGLPDKVTTYEYLDPNTADSPSRVVDALGRSVKYAYNGWGITDSVVDARGHRTKFVYDTDSGHPTVGVLLSVTERSVETWREQSNPATDTTAAPIDLTTTFSYDARGNRATSTSPAGTTTSYVADGAGRVTDVYSPLGMRQQYVYDVMNRTTRVRRYTAPQVNPYGIDPLAGCTAAAAVICADSAKAVTGTTLQSLATVYAYSDFGLASVLDSARGIARTYAHDALGQLVTETDDYGYSKGATYNVPGLTASTVSRTGQAVNYQYDAAGRLKQLDYPSVYQSRTYTKPTVPGDVAQYSYDLLGNQISAKNKEGTISREYYADGSLRRKITAIGGTPDTLTYSYDATGALARLVNGRDTTDYVYNATTGALDAMVVTWGSWVSYHGLGSTVPGFTRRFDFEWDGLGRRRTVVYPTNPSNPAANMRVSYRYDANGSLRRLVSNGQKAFALTFRNKIVDPVGRILRQEMQCASVVYGDPCGKSNISRTKTNQYDRLGMLVLQFDNAQSDSMKYDASGNMTYRHVAGGTTGGHILGVEAGHNRLVADTLIVPVGSAPSVRIFEYDENGSRTYEGRPGKDPQDLNSRWYYYDGLGRMTGTADWAVIPSGTGGYTQNWVDHPDACRYDPDGQMTGACQYGTAQFAFDGANIVQTLTVNREQAWTFVHGPGLDDPLTGYFRATNGTSRLLYYLTDGNGRQFTVADSAGSMWEDDENTDRSDYHFAGGTDNSYGFGAERLKSTDVPQVAFFRNRVYDQQTGRWTQEDPSGVAGGINLYQFNGNNPVSYTDPFGLCPVEKDGIPCTAGDLLSFAVTFGGQVDVAVMPTAYVGGYLHAQVGPVVGIKVTKAGAEVIDGDSETSVEVGFQAGTMRGGAKKNFGENTLSGAGAGPSYDPSPSTERVQRDGRGGSTKISVGVGIQTSIEVNWDAAKEIGRRMWNSITR
ncbi:MAG TPA: RHS repeat-associated core domain-containing protein [Gemmatimonadales bacterium]|nr:RHS repeat-associated core domain-containing protein [Gemmatimonadales bacterium]